MRASRNCLCHVYKKIFTLPVLSVDMYWKEWVRLLVTSSGKSCFFFFFIWIIIKRLPLKRTHKAACFRHSAFYWFCTPNCTLISVSIIDISKSNCVGSHLLTAVIARWWFKGVPQGSDLGPLYLKKKTFKDIENNRYKRQNPIQACSMSNKGISALTLNGPTVTFFFVVVSSWNSNNLLFTNAET